MAGVYNLNSRYRWENDQSNSKDINKLKYELNNERQANMLLKEELHNKKMTILTIRKKMQTLREENSVLVSSQKSPNNNFINQQNVEEMKNTIADYEQIIRRLTNEKKQQNELKTAINSLQDKIGNYERNFKIIRTENIAYKNKLDEITNLFKKLKSEKFEENETLFEFQNLLAANSSVKMDPETSLERKSTALNSNLRKKESDLLISFFDYVKPVGKKEENMHLLNKYIFESIKPQKLTRQSNIAELVVQYFNRAQSVAFLFPAVAEFVTSAEKAEAESGLLPFSEGIGMKAIVAEEDWPPILKEFCERRDEMPPVLMLTAKERKGNNAHYVLFVLSVASSMVLRYDPLVLPIKGREYRRVYSNVFAHYTDFSDWTKRHLVREENSISWVYCVEFARRFTMMVEEEGMEWIEKNTMRGREGNAGVFASIDFDLLADV